MQTHQVPPASVRNSGLFYELKKYSAKKREEIFYRKCNTDQIKTRAMAQSDRQDEKQLVSNISFQIYTINHRSNNSS